MSDLDIILQIMFISLGMVALGLILNRLMGLNLETAKELRDKALNLQQRMKTAQITGDHQEMVILQRESTALMKQMMKKQLIPSSIRCIIFIAIFAIISIFYGSFPNFYLYYFLFSISFSLLAYGIKKLYRKLTGKVDSRTKISREIMSVLSPTSEETGSSFQLTRPLPSKTNTEVFLADDKTEKLDSWKDRIKRNP